MAGFRRGAALIAAILLLAFGVVFWWEGTPLVGVVLIVAGLLLTLWQGWRWYQTRPRRRQDPYDLSRLWEYDPIDPVIEEPAEEQFAHASETNGTVYCHHCGHAVPDLFAFCPECGNRL